jgi:hypothetical protein
MPAIDFKAVKLRVSLRQVLDLLRWQPSSIEGFERRGPCPIHGSSSPASRSFATFADGFTCHSCKASGDQLRLYSLVRRLNIYAATVELCGRLAVEVPYLPRVRKARKPRGEQEEER